MVEKPRPEDALSRASVLAVLDSAGEPWADPPDTAQRVIAVIGERRAAHFVLAWQLVQRAAVGLTES